MAGPSDLNIAPAGRERLDELEPLWKALHQHHARITPRLESLPTREPDDSWRRRAQKYRQLLGEPGTFVLIAERETAVGYAFVAVGTGLTSWAGGEEVAQLETLSVIPREQGRGVGAALLAAAQRQLAVAGVTDLLVTTLTNERSHRFYERHGLEAIFKVVLGKVEER